MRRLGMLAGLLLPGSHRPLIQAERAHDRLQRTAKGEQAHHPDHHLARVLEAVEDRAFVAGEGLATDPTSPAIA